MTRIISAKAALFLANPALVSLKIPAIVDNNESLLDDFTGIYPQVWFFSSGLLTIR